MAPELHRRGLLTEWDREAFIVLCEAVAQHKQACELVSGTNVLIKGYRSQLVKNPALQVVRDTSQTIRAYAQEFGLTPSARSSISIEGANDAADVFGILD
jgi:P27 family predicted phage terminase small subunit